MRSTLLASMLLRRSPIRLASAERCSTKWRNEGRRTTSSSGPSSASCTSPVTLGRSMRLLGYAPLSWRHRNKRNKATRNPPQPSRQLKINLNWISWFFRCFDMLLIFKNIHQVQFSSVLLPAGSWCTCEHTISSLVVLVVSLPFYVCFFQFRCLFSSGSVFLLS